MLGQRSEVGHAYSHAPGAVHGFNNTERVVRTRYCLSAPRVAAEFIHLQNDVTLRAVLPLNCESLVRGPRDGAQVVISE